MRLDKLALLALGGALLVAPAALAQPYEGQGYEGQVYQGQGYQGQGYQGQGYDDQEDSGAYGPPSAYGERDYGQGEESGERGYGQPYGDSDSRPGAQYAYPQFRGLEAHIQRAVSEAMRDNRLGADEGRGLMHRLHEIQRQEAREFGGHGWNLPYPDQQRIGGQLRELDRQVDQLRDER